MALSIISLNVNGLCEPSKCEGLLQWLQSLPVMVDVVCLQDTHGVSDVECHSWFSSSGLSFVLSSGSRRPGGCIILYCPVLQLVNSWCESPGRSLLCEVLCMMSPFMFYVCMPQIATLLETFSLIASLTLLIFPFPRFCAVTLIWSLIVPSIVSALLLMTC